MVSNFARLLDISINC